jgi:hypothetical protein
MPEMMRIIDVSKIQFRQYFRFFGNISTFSYFSNVLVNNRPCLTFVSIPMKSNNHKPTEQHPLFPSGPWNGFYTYTQGADADQHPMPCTLEFVEGILSGRGSDDVGVFSLTGFYNTQSMTCQMTKKYASHIVDYQGRIDENGIWGCWTMSGWKGGFHLWPKETKKEEEKATVAVKGLLEELSGKQLF